MDVYGNTTFNKKYQKLTEPLYIRYNILPNICDLIMLWVLNGNLRLNTGALILDNHLAVLPLMQPLSLS